VQKTAAAGVAVLASVSAPTALAIRLATDALDKLAGALARQAVNGSDGIVVVSSRASFEMVQKTAAAGVAVLASVSAPTALAIRLATDVNVTLLGFTRDGDATIYTHPERILT